MKIEDVSFGYEEKIILHNISLEIQKGTNIALIGESGCGKSTLLKVLYGLYDVHTGHITWDGKPVLGPKYHLVPGMDFIKYLAQDFGLMPYITAAENVGKFLSNINAAAKKQRVMDLLSLVEMEEFADVQVQYLSGGQQQRIALAKVLALEPEVLLLDEPFSHMDNFRKNALRRNLFAYLKSKGITCITATHDSVDALSFSDYTAVLEQGRIVDFDASKSVYFYPKTKYIASLFGEVNEVMLSDLQYLNEEDDQTVLLYPHQLRVMEKGLLKVKVRGSYFRGSHFLIKGTAQGKVYFFESKNDLIPNMEVFIGLNKR